MFNKLKEYAGVGAFILLLVSFFLPNASPAGKLGNATASYVDAALGFRVNGTEVVSSAGVVDGTVSSTALAANSLTLSGGTAMTKFSCATTTYTLPQLGPGYLGGTHFATTSVTISGAALGDLAWATLDTATNSLQFYGVTTKASVITSSTAVVQFFNETNTTSTIIPTSTLKVCYSH